MTKTIFFILFLLFFFNSFSQKKESFFQNENQNFIVVLDPGHGGKDSGTKTNNKILEKDINLYVSKYIQLHLKEFAPNIQVILTRENDQFISLKKRPLYAKITGADLFISIHCNHNQKNQAKGLEIYIQKMDKITNKEHLKNAHLFGYLLNDILIKKLEYKSRGIKYKNLSVLRNSINFVPSVLIELGFFSNKNDSEYLTSKNGMDGIALAISKSIIDFFE